MHRVLEHLEPESLDEAYTTARERGPGWRKKVDAGRDAMLRQFG